MNPKPANIINKFLITLLILVFGALVFVATQQFSAQKLAGEITGVASIAGTNLDPLLSGRPCFTGNQAVLEVHQLDGETFDWYVTPPANVLLTPGKPVSSRLNNAPAKIYFISPQPNDPNAALEYRVDVVLHNSVSGGESFEVNVGAPCVRSLEFVSPKGTVTPVEGEIVLNSVRATFWNGQTVTYDSSQIPQLNLDFISEPAGQVQFAGSRIRVPFEHAETRIFMQSRVNSVSPIIFGQNNPVNQTLPSRYLLNSSEVDPESVEVWMVTGLRPDGIPDALLTLGTDYVFREASLPSEFDSIEWIRTQGETPEILYISYFYRPLTELARSEPLTIAPVQCELLQANLYQGRGQGFYLPEEGDTQPSGSHSQPFDFTAEGGNAVRSILLSNPVSAGTTFGSRDFELRFDFVTALSQRAFVANRSGTHYEIQVRSDDDRLVTAGNFAYAVNSLLGDSAPFVAYIDPSDNRRVVLYSVEVGNHTNAYQCSIDGAETPACFSGGVTGTRADGTAILDVNPPRPMDSVMNQGETRVVYSRGGFSNLTWRTSDANILSAEPLSEALSSPLLGNENVTLNAGSITLSNLTLPVPGSQIATTSDCEFEENEEEADTLKSCNVSLTLPVTFNPNPAGYSIAITPSTGDPIAGTIQGNSASGIFTASGAIDAVTGGPIQLTGQLTVPVGGDAIGSLQANITVLVTISSFDNPNVINQKWAIASATGTLSKVNLIPTDRTPNQGGAAVTNFAILTAKRPGRATLFVTDSLGCTAPLEVQVIGQRLFIDFQNTSQGEFIEQGDSIQLRAWTGFRGATNANNDVTNLAQWQTDNSNVLSVSATGRVTALQLGVANVFARFNTTVPETGTVTSEGSLRIHVDELYGLTVSLDRETLSRLPAEQSNSAYRSVAVIVHKPSAAGRSIRLGDRTIPVELPLPEIPYADELEQIQGIVRGTAAENGLLHTLAMPGARISPHPRLPGVLLIESDQPVNISTTALPEEITLLPAFTGGLQLPSADTYRMIAVGEYDSGRTRLLNPANVEWVATPVNILNDTALETGLLKYGDRAGAATLVAKYENPDKTIIQSNALNVRIEEGPVVEFVRRIGSGPILKNSRVSLLMRARDIDSIADIQTITASLVRSSQTTYEGIHNDPDAVWFLADTFLDQTSVTPVAAPNAPVQTTPASADSAVQTQETPAPVAQAPGTADSVVTSGQPQLSPLYSDFTIPITVPSDVNLIDGTYRLVISISDRAGHTANFVLPNFRIGPVALGDVNGDGRLNMIDVILAFRIANGSLSPAPTQTQLQSANMDGRGNVTMIDVILLFVRVNSPTT